MLTPIQTRAILMTGVNQLAVETVEIPRPGERELLIEAEYTCISPGTELRCLAGLQPDLQWPFIPGYAMVGRVAEGGANSTLAIGTRVICSGTQRANRNLAWGGHVGHAVVQEDQVQPIPGEIESLDAVITKLAAIAYRGWRMSQPALHDSVAVIGLGAVGQFAARLHRLSGARVVAADLNADRVAVAQAAGVEAFVTTGKTMASDFRERLPDGAQVVVDATGVPQVFSQAMAIASEKAWRDGTPGPRLIVQGSYPDSIAVSYHEAFRREMSVWFPRDFQFDDLRAILALMGRGLLRGADLISAICQPDEAPQTYQALQAGRLITAAFKWGH